MTRSRRPKLAVVAGTPQLLDAAHELGVETVLVHTAQAPLPATAHSADQVITVDRVDGDAVHAALAPSHARRPFDRVLSLTENGLLPAAEAAHRFGVPGNPLRAVRALQDKRAMRELLNAHQLSPVRARSVESLADLTSFRSEIGGPVILKPASGSASRAVCRVDEPQDAAAAWQRFLHDGGEDPVAEEYLDGPEISVEAFSYDGRHTIVAFTDKNVLPNYVEIGHTVPGSLAGGQRKEVCSLVRDFLDVVGLHEGPSHTEVKLTSRGPRVIESHNRIGGDKIRELVRRAYGVDLVRLTAGCALGLLTPPTAPSPHAGAAIRFLAPPPGVVRRIILPETPELSAGMAVIHLDVAVGDRAGEVRASADRSGYVLAEGADAADAARHCEHLASQVVIETEPVAHPAAPPREV